MEPEEEQLIRLINGGGSVSFHPDCTRYCDDADISLKELIIFDFSNQIWDEDASLSKIKLVHNLFLKYFDIFQTPVVFIEHPTLRFGKLILPSEINDRINKFMSKYNLESHRSILLQLMAQIFDFIREDIKLWSGKELLNAMRNFIPEMNQIIAIKRLLKSDSESDLKMEVKIKFIPGKEFRFTNQKLIHNYILKDFSNVEPSNIEPNLSKRINLMPYKNNYEAYFRNQLIRSLHAFLCDESEIKPALGKKISEEQLYVISDFLELCKIDLKDKSNNPVTDESHRWGIIKTAIARHRSST